MKLEDWLYQEVDDSCALCGLRGVELLTIHHIDENHTNNVYENTIVLCHNCHKRFHDGKGITTVHVRDRKRHLIHKTLTTHGLIALKRASRETKGVVAPPFLLYHLVELGYMEKREDVMGYMPDDALVSLGGAGSAEQSDALAWFAITQRGEDLLSKWFEE